MRIIPKIALAVTFLSTAGGAANAWAAGSFTLGGELYHDQYREPDDVGVDSHGDAGGITGSYTYGFSDNLFTTLEGRFDYEKNNYESPSGNLDGTNQYETEERLRIGMNIPVQGMVFSPYVGGGARFFWDNGDHKVTNLGYMDYDRAILQLYVPVGLSYQFHVGDWTFTPKSQYPSATKR